LAVSAYGAVKPCPLLELELNITNVNFMPLRIVQSLLQSGKTECNRPKVSLSGAKQ